MTHTAIEQEILSMAARILAHSRTGPVRQVMCASCGKLTPVRGRGKYCNDVCKNRAFRKRQKETGAQP